eukprot:TRINITY_DN9207_c0_g1_i1.p2 TRINITY_DN9207_c0_g1~~TRINITY_DN9207_c0_g1_i1.p2  ORF type:complete len:128 (+),score=2.52 TRINITY_DN9207_c0_g1_i1:1-384(+)
MSIYLDFLRFSPVGEIWFSGKFLFVSVASGLGTLILFYVIALSVSQISISSFVPEEELVSSKIQDRTTKRVTEAATSHLLASFLPGAGLLINLLQRIQNHYIPRQNQVRNQNQGMVYYVCQLYCLIF